jgi:putative sigma-54 modulation protein
LTGRIPSLESRSSKAKFPALSAWRKKESTAVQVAITSRHGHLSPGAQEHIRQKAEKLLTYFERVTAITVTTDLERDNAVVEILVDAEHKHNFVATETAPNVLAAFDSALHKMEQQIRKYKEKIQDHRRTTPLSDLPQPESEDEQE